MKSTLCKYLPLFALAVFVLASSPRQAEATINETPVIDASVNDSDLIDIKFYLVREAELVGVISAIQSSASFKQLTFSELHRKKGELYLVACVDNNLDKRAWGSGSVTYYPKREIIINFISIPANVKKIITVVPLGMPLLPWFEEKTPEFTWKWKSLSAK